MPCKTSNRYNKFFSFNSNLMKVILIKSLRLIGVIFLLEISKNFIYIINKIFLISTFWVLKFLSIDLFYWIRFKTYQRSKYLWDTRKSLIINLTLAYKDF